MVILIVWIAFILSEQRKKFESHKKVCKNKDFCNVIIPSKDILECNQYHKSDKAQFIPYTDLECVK